MTTEPKAPKLTLAKAREEHARLQAEIAEHDHALSRRGRADHFRRRYDALRRRYTALEETFPELADADSANRKVGAAPSEKFAKVRHRVPMLSLGNIFADEEVEEFGARVRRFLGLGEARRSTSSRKPRSTASPAACATRMANSFRRRRAATATKART